MGKNIKNFEPSNTFSLFNRPSLWEGFARLTDYYGNLNCYNYSETGELADITALKNDWASLNQDMLRSYREVYHHYVKEKEEKEIQKQTESVSA